MLPLTIFYLSVGQDKERNRMVLENWWISANFQGESWKLKLVKNLKNKVGLIISYFGFWIWCMGTRLASTVTLWFEIQNLHLFLVSPDSISSQDKNVWSPICLGPEEHACWSIWFHFLVLYRDLKVDFNIPSFQFRQLVYFLSKAQLLGFHFDRKIDLKILDI